MLSNFKGKLITIIFIVLVLGWLGSTFFHKGSGSIEKPKKIEGAVNSSALSPSVSASSVSPRPAAYNTSKATVSSSPLTSLSSSVSSTTAPATIDASKYVKSTPRVRRLTRDDSQNKSYSGDVAELKLKADSGDLHAKFLYAQKMQEALDQELARNYDIGAVIPSDAAKDWNRRYEEVRKLYYSCAVEGRQGCVHGLIQTPYHPSLRDDTDTVAWIFIMGGMTGRVELAINRFCGSLKLDCTQELLQKGFERANFYVDYYNFSLEKDPVSE